MRICTETMERLAALSKLELSATELAQLSGELETIIDYMNILAQIPGEDAGTAPFNGLRNVLREDKMISGINRSELLSNAPETDGVTLTVPKTVE